MNSLSTKPVSTAFSSARHPVKAMAFDAVVVKHKHQLGAVLRYLPHVVVTAILIALLLLASYGAPTGRQPAQPETHLGQHL
jgi:hypothetical protein